MVTRITGERRQLKGKKKFADYLGFSRSRLCYTGLQKQSCSVCWKSEVSACQGEATQWGTCTANKRWLKPRWLFAASKMHLKSELQGCSLLAEASPQVHWDSNRLVICSAETRAHLHPGPRRLTTVGASVSVSVCVTLTRSILVNRIQDTAFQSFSYS